MATKTNCVINGRAYFRITRTIGHKTVDGKRVAIKKQFLGSSKGNAERKYKEFLEEQARIKNEGQMVQDTATLHDRAHEYIENVLTVSTKYAQGTKNLYRGAYRNHIEGTWIDKMAVKDIKASTVQKFYNELPVSKSTLLRIGKFLSALYKWMVLNEYATNVLTAVEMPEKTDTKKHDDVVVWADEDLHTLMTANLDFRASFLIKLMSYTGMRISECLGLKYGDIWDDTIHVCRQYNLGKLKDPKCNSKREIPMHPMLITAYEEYRAWHEAEMEKNGYQSDFVFTTSTGNLCTVQNLRKTFDRIYRDLGIESRGFHVYRATFCTNLCKAGVPLEVASKLMGHKSLEVTAAHYALIHKETKREAIEKLKL